MNKFLNVIIKMPLFQVNDLKVIVPYNSIEDNFIDVLRRQLGDDCTLSFDDYYHDTELIIYGNCFPYIYYNEDVICWNVPVEDVTIRDFLFTNNLDADSNISVYVNNFGGEGDLLEIAKDILPWILFYVDNFNRMSDFLTGIKSFIGWLKACFVSNNKLVNLENVKEGLRKKGKRKGELKETELRQILATDDLKLISDVAKASGFIKKGDIYYLKDENTTLYDEIEIDVQGKEEKNNLYYACEKLNDTMIVLRAFDFEGEVSFFGYVNEKLEEIIDKGQKYICEGEGRCFVYEKEEFQSVKDDIDPEEEYEDEDEDYEFQEDDDNGLLDIDSEQLFKLNRSISLLNSIALSMTAYLISKKLGINIEDLYLTEIS